MKTKAIIPLAIGLAVGLVAVKYTLDTVNAAQGSGAPTGLLTVVMAGQDIPSCAAIAPNMLTVAETPKTSLLPDTVFAKVEDLAGRVADRPEVPIRICGRKTGGTIR